MKLNCLIFIFLCIQFECIFKSLADKCSPNQVECGGDVSVKLYEFITADEYIPEPSSLSHCDWKISLDITEDGPHLPLQLHINDKNDNFETIYVYDGDNKNAPLLKPYDDNDAKYEATGTQLYVSVYYAKTSVDRCFHFNATAKIKGYCPGMYSCGDGENCYTESEKCDSTINCQETMEDQRGCNGCAMDLFGCGVGFGLPSCFPASERCNYNKMCPFPYLDEKDCTHCQPGTVLCHGISANVCIEERRVCDQLLNCPDLAQQYDCSPIVNRRMITAAVIGSLICGLLFVLALGCTCKLYMLRVSHYRRTHYTTFGRFERVMFRREAPPTYDMSVEGRNPDSGRYRRQRSSRYPFRRANPAEIPSENQPSSSRTDEGVQQTNGSQQTTTTQPASRNRMTSLLFESVPSVVSEMLSGSTSNAVRTRDSETQTSTSQQPCTSSSTQNSQQPRQSVGSSNSQTCRGRSSRRVRRSRESQASKLPKKKKIPPVMVPAPYSSDAVEDTANCLYPMPPTYDQALQDTSPPVQQQVEIPHSLSMPAVSMHETSTSSSPRKLFFKNPLSAMLKASPRSEHSNQGGRILTSSPKRNLFNLRSLTPSFFRSDPGYSYMQNEPCTSLEGINTSQANQSIDNSSDDEIINVTVSSLMPDPAT